MYNLVVSARMKQSRYVVKGSSRLMCVVLKQHNKMCLALMWPLEETCVRMCVQSCTHMDDVMHFSLRKQK